MPVWLDAIPEKAANVERPDTRRWLIFLIGVLVIGAISIAWFWQGERGGLLFWSTATGLPLCIWGLLFCLRRVAYKANQVGVQSWNSERKQLITSEIARGQRPAWILDIKVESKAGQHVTAIKEAVETAFPVLERYVPPGRTAAIQYAALSHRGISTESALQSVVGKLITAITETLAPLRIDLNCWLLIDSHCAAADLVEALIAQQLNTLSGRSFSRITQPGLAGFDQWLDVTQDAPAVLVVIALHLPETPRADGADAITATVLANRPSTHYPDATCLHRPERGSSSALDKALERALLWAAISAADLKGAVISGSISQGSAWSNACDSHKVAFSMTADLTAPDAIIGYTDIASPWLMIALAQVAVAPGEAQAIACQPSSQSEDVWVMVVKKDQEEKELTGNV